MIDEYTFFVPSREVIDWFINNGRSEDNEKKNEKE